VEKRKKVSSEENICALPNNLAKLITRFISLFSDQLLLGKEGGIFEKEVFKMN
jgi:hypothetical protein